MSRRTHDGFNAAERELMVCLGEECAETGQAVTKALRFGIDHARVEGGPDNRANLETEIGDLICVVDMLARAGLVDQARILAKAEAKQVKLRRHLHYGGDSLLPVPYVSAN